MNYAATRTIFDRMTERKLVLKDRIQSIEDFSKVLNGEEKQFVRNELAPLKDEYDWLTQFQMDILRALYTGEYNGDKT